MRSIAGLLVPLVLMSCSTEEKNCTQISIRTGMGCLIVTKSPLEPIRCVLIRMEMGFRDAEELDCVSDPLNEEEVCYECGWAHNDPGDLVSQGAEQNDVLADVQLIDQCGERVDLWDFYGEYHILYLTAAW